MCKMTLLEKIKGLAITGARNRFNLKRTFSHLQETSTARTSKTSQCTVQGDRQKTTMQLIGNPSCVFIRSDLILTVNFCE